MEKINEFFKKIFNIPEPIAFIVAAAGFLILALAFNGADFLRFLAYPLSSYGVVALIVALTKIIPRLVDYVLNSAAWKRLEEVPFVGELIVDKTVRMRFFLYFGTVVNILYVILKISTGFIYHSLWLSFMGGYYLALAVLRGFIIHFERKYDEDANIALEYKRYRACGMLLFLLDQTLILIIWLAAEFKANLDYPGILIYGIALYSFYAIILAIYNLITERKKERPMYTAARIATFTAALVSMLSLEIAMMARFGADDHEMRLEMTVWTGTLVFLIVTYMSMMMIVRGTKEYRKHLSEN